MNMEEKLRAVVEKASIDGDLWHNIVHGDETSETETENGKVPSVAKQLKDVHDAIIGGVIDVVSKAESTLDETIIIKEQTEEIKDKAQEICDETKILRDEAKNFKELSQTTFNNIATATSMALENIQDKTSTQIENLENSVEEQIGLAKSEADRSLYYAQCASPTPLGSKLTIPACAKIPDGYEPTWYKNKITRARYPDFFAKLLDNNDLCCVDEKTYDATVLEYGMCNSYVKIDNDTLILPLLLNYGRGGVSSQVGQVQKDQFQAHQHTYQMKSIRGGTTSGGDNQNLGISNYNTFGYIADGSNEAPRFGDETRPKSYYELTYIKCADVVRPLAVEETSEIRNEFVQKTKQVLDYLKGVVQIVEEQRGINGYIKYSDGRMEQWGRTPHAGTSWITTNFNIPFSNDNVNMLLTALTPSSLVSGSPSPNIRYDVDAIRFIWHIPTGNGWNCYWRAWGEWK